VSIAENWCVEDALFRGTICSTRHWRVVGRREPASRMEQLMRNNLLAIAAIVAAFSAPIALRAQTVGVGPGGTVVVEEAPGIAVEQYPAFREHVVRERIPDYSIPGRITVGTVLPEMGVTFYDVPPSIAATPYRYTIVNGSTVLVEPRTRRVVQIVE
jgi:hypothetical protein